MAAEGRLLAPAGEDRIGRYWRPSEVKRWAARWLSHPEAAGLDRALLRASFSAAINLGGEMLLRRILGDESDCSIPAWRKHGHRCPASLGDFLEKRLDPEIVGV
jgi:hypothetical protein